MAAAEIHAGACGFTALVRATMDGNVCRISIESECESIRELGRRLTEVSPFHEISFKKGRPMTLELGEQCCAHAACPVPVGIVKAIEIAAGLNLPADVAIKLSK